MCSLNLVCYRSGAQGCQIRQIQTLNRSRFNDEKELEKILDEQPDIISTDVELFTALRREYLERMCGFWRRATSMKTLSGFRLLQVRYVHIWCERKKKSLGRLALTLLPRFSVCCG